MFKINLKFTNMPSDDSLKGYLEKRLKKIVDIAGGMQEEIIFRVEIGKTKQHQKTGDIHRAEIQVFIGGKEFRVVTEEEGIRAAIDSARDSILRDIKNQKRKNVTTLRKGGRKIKEMLRKFYR